ncbi:MAG TPA: RelA/SpoT domain-containing protein [Synergistaceae bacterium]|nr:RelA/SpoT domain-containing protein [Synergistaceae bacterium]HQH78887.1 RelA/SpoT domain-containing protein [Synergistaceae bacterium]
MDAQSIGEWKDRYIRKHDLYVGYTERLKHLVQDLLENLGLELFHIESSTKSIERFVEEISEPGAEYADPFAEMADLSCVRVILYFAEDLDKVAAVVEEEFQTVREESVPFDDMQDPDAYGYRSIEYSLYLSRARSDLREWQKYASLKARIQVRTILQNAWSAITEKFPAGAVFQPKSLVKRKLGRMSALLEEADEGFLTLWEFVKQGPFSSGPRGVSAPSRTGGAPAGSPLGSVSLTTDTLETFFRTSPERLDFWVGVAREIGLPLVEPGADYLRKSLENLALILVAADIATPAALDAFLSAMATESRGRQHLLTIYRSFEGEIAGWRIDAYSVLFLLVLNAKWDVLQHKDLVAYGIKTATDRIKGLSR